MLFVARKMFTSFWTEACILQPFVLFHSPSEVNCFDGEFQKSWRRDQMKSLSVDKAVILDQTAEANSFQEFKQMYLL